MLVLYHREGGWSSLNREKRGDGLDELNDDGKGANRHEEPKHTQDGLGVDLISFHVYMIA